MRLIAWGMSQQRLNTGGNEDHKLRQGLVFGVLISIPIWAAIGIAVVLPFQEGPITAVQKAVLIVCAVVEFILLRRIWRGMEPRTVYRALVSHSRAAVVAARPANLKPGLLLLGLVGAYLHYYFWDVQLQIASLNSVTVFVNAPALG